MTANGPSKLLFGNGIPFCLNGNLAALVGVGVQKV
jgi:hypothetical protein